MYHKQGLIRFNTAATLGSRGVATTLSAVVALNYCITVSVMDAKSP